MKIINKMGSPLEINLIGGSSVIIPAGETLPIDDGTIYDHEVERISKYCEIQKERVKKVFVEPEILKKEEKK